MIAISTNEGILHIYAEVKIPSAQSGTWSPARIGKLIELIQDTVEAAEQVDDAERIPYERTAQTIRSSKLIRT